MFMVDVYVLLGRVAARSLQFAEDSEVANIVSSCEHDLMLHRGINFDAFTAEQP